MSLPFYDSTSSPILIIGAFGIAVAIEVFLFLTKNISILLWKKELAEKKKALIKEQKELNERLEKIEQNLKKFIKNFY